MPIDYSSSSVVSRILATYVIVSKQDIVIMIHSFHGTWMVSQKQSHDMHGTFMIIFVLPN